MPQVYHHVGIAVSMWMAVVTQSNWVIWVVVLNSGIHALMYTYYAAATLGYRSPYAKVSGSSRLGSYVKRFPA